MKGKAIVVVVVLIIIIIVSLFLSHSLNATLVLISVHCYCCYIQYLLLLCYYTYRQKVCFNRKSPSHFLGIWLLPFILSLYVCTWIYPLKLKWNFYVWTKAFNQQKTYNEKWLLMLLLLKDFSLSLSLNFQWMAAWREKTVTEAVSWIVFPATRLDLNITISPRIKLSFMANTRFEMKLFCSSLSSACISSAVFCSTLLYPYPHLICAFAICSLLMESSVNNVLANDIIPALVHTYNISEILFVPYFFCSLCMIQGMNVMRGRKTKYDREKYSMWKNLHAWNFCVYVCNSMSVHACLLSAHECMEKMNF